MAISDDHRFEPIGVLHSPFRDKFGIPRQAGLAPVETRLELFSPYNRPEALAGLESFSHVWLQFVFHRIPRNAWKPSVRPPRLGGNQRVGVFASRSPFRPNRLGLSLVRLLSLDESGAGLRLLGADLLDGTPVLDIKPYLPWAEAPPDAEAGWAGAPPRRLAVRFSPRAEAALAARAGKITPELLSDLLSLDPRPAYHQVSSREYGMRFGDLEIKWRVDERGVWVSAVDSTTDSH